MPQIANQINLIRFFVFSFPVAFLSIRHGVHIALYGTLLLFIYELSTTRSRLHASKKSLVIFASLSSIFIATAIQQAMVGNFNPNAFDGPSRLLIAGIVFLYLRHKNINYFNIIEIAIPISLIFLTIYFQLNQKYFWGQRWANSFVDPNSLGSQATILSLICILTIDINSKKNINFLKLIGMLCGFYISIKTESRGGWSTIPFMVICWLLIKFREDWAHNKNQVIIVISTLCLIIIGATLLISFNSSVSNRISHTIYEITTWFKDPLIYTSAGSRMSMWVVSFELIKENIWGYGELAIKNFSLNHPFYLGIHQNGFRDLVAAGPHSDILGKGLSLGIIGIAAYLLTLFIPARIFFKKINSPNKNIQKSAEMGLIYITGVFIAGLFNESFALKYLCTFYGLMIACLAAQVLNSNKPTHSLPNDVTHESK